MPPQFRFQTILDLRKRTEDERQMELAQALQAVAALRARQERVQVERLRVAENLQGTLHGSVDAGNLEQQYRYLTSLDERLHHLADDLHQADETVVLQRHRLADALKERKTMEKLKEYAHQAFLNTYLHKEREAIDDLNVSRFGRQR